VEADEIRAAIAERKSRARDLKLRESLWALYSSHLEYFQDQLHKDPELIAPEIRDTLRFLRETIEFRVGSTLYKLCYRKGRVEIDRWGGDKVETTHATIDLDADGKSVFLFELRKSVTYAPDMPLFHTYMGEIDSFIEGPWVTELPALVDNLAKHKKNVWDRRNTPKLFAEMKKFGL